MKLMYNFVADPSNHSQASAAKCSVPIMFRAREKHLLSSGIPCMIHNCVKCCIETRMPLSRIDIERIFRQGYRFKDFVVKRKRERRLKNRNGRCVFLGDNGCIIYSFRPEGCWLYPLVYNEKNRKVVVHDLCPYGNEFKVSGGDIEKLHAFFKKLSKKAVIKSTALALF